MATKKTGLGRGLEALLGPKVADAPAGTVSSELFTLATNFWVTCFDTPSLMPRPTCTMRPVRSVLDSQRTSVLPSGSESRLADMVPLTVPPPFSFASASRVSSRALSSSLMKVIVPS